MWLLSTNVFSSIKEKVDKSKVFHVKAFIYITKKPTLKNFHQDFMHLYGPWTIYAKISFTSPLIQERKGGFVVLFIYCYIIKSIPVVFLKL